MAQRLTPRKSFFCALMFLVFPHTGISNKNILITHTKEDTADILTCLLSGNATVIQTSWVVGVVPNRTTLGMFHPEHGTHVPQQYSEQVDIHSETSKPQETSLVLKNWAMNESNIFCCVFTTFPTGTLDHCIDMNKINTTHKVLKHDKQTGDEQWLVENHALWAGAGILLLLILSMFIFICCRKNFRRSKVFEIQTTSVTSLPASLPADSRQPPSEITDQTNTMNPPLGFDPSKLYAKIKKDLHYGRLWKSYQGRPQTLNPGPREATRTRSHPTPKKIYSLLGEHSPPQTQEQEPTRTDGNA